LNGASGIPAVEQLHFHSNTQIEEVLRMLKDRGTFLNQESLITGYSNVSGLRAEGMRSHAMIVPFIALFESSTGLCN
jgi:hypothetical protein